MGAFALGVWELGIGNWEFPGLDMNKTTRFGRVIALGAIACAGLYFQTPLRSQAAQASTRIEIAAGSTAEYRVREQLARLNFPNDAVGKTDSLTGSIVVGPGGAITPGSKLTVDMRDLQSDSDRRDNFLRQNTLHTSRFPTAEFVPRRQEGLPSPLPSSGKAAFKLIGDMTVHGVTTELVWDVATSFAPGTVSGEATTRFQFAKFGLTIPKVMGLLSVDDDIRLVLNFKARRVEVPAAASSSN
jgi:polyisoprenoid-binding protein YceI